MKKSDIATVVVFCTAIGTTFIMNIATPDRDFSDTENRALQTFPQLSFDRLLSGKLSTEIEDYVTDQFIFRDDFIELKSDTEFALGKDENNSVFLSKSNTLIERFVQPDYDLIDRNIAGINQFKEIVDVPVYTMIIPTQVDIHSDLLPDNAPTYPQERMISYVYGQVTDTINVYDVLKEKSSEYIFYNTDHHWTSRGAYYGYATIIEALGRSVLELDSFQENAIASDFNGTIYNKSGIRKADADTVIVYTDNQEILVQTGESVEEKMLYDESYIEKNDKYALFLGGNDPIVKIHGEGIGKILFVKDSYTNSMAPFFLKQYEEVHLIDLRFMRQGVSEYIEEFGIDEVIICYSAGNFADDKNLQLIK